jgi:hypothetical protein
MWNEQKRQRFQYLRDRQSAGVLEDTERAELTLLMDELQAAEARYLRPATQRLQDEREIVEAQNRALEVLLRRKERLAQRLEDFLAEAQAERRAIEGELAAVLVGSRDGNSGG